jgi:hypothetical protein
MADFPKKKILLGIATGKPKESSINSSAIALSYITSLGAETMSFQFYHFEEQDSARHVLSG